MQVRGELAGEDVEVLRLSALRGLFSAVIEDQVTFVNAPAIAEERGVAADSAPPPKAPTTAASSMSVRWPPTARSVNVAGTLSGPQQVEKIVQINGRNFDLRAEGINLVVHYVDQPGALGKIGTLLGHGRGQHPSRAAVRGRRGPGRDDPAAPGPRRARRGAGGDQVRPSTAYKLKVVDLS